MPRAFDHEKLIVYQKAIAFAAWTGPLFDRIPKSAALHGQLDRASLSIALNIAEGNGRFTAPDRCRFFDIARGSALETAACLDLAGARGLIPQSELEPGKDMLREIVSLLVGLIRSNAPERVCESEVEAPGEIQGGRM
jgi:four helix bundle protein